MPLSHQFGRSLLGIPQIVHPEVLLGILQHLLLQHRSVRLHESCDLLLRGGLRCRRVRGNLHSRTHTSSVSLASLREPHRSRSTCLPGVARDGRASHPGWTTRSSACCAARRRTRASLLYPSAVARHRWPSAWAGRGRSRLHAHARCCSADRPLDRPVAPHCRPRRGDAARREEGRSTSCPGSSR
jgi:hypothetical protein